MRAARALLAPALVVLLPACSGQTCTEMGSVDGLVVEVAPGLLRGGPASVGAEVCDDEGCVRGTAPVPRGGAGVDGPVLVDVSPAALGRPLEAGSAVVEVVLEGRRGEPLAALFGAEVVLEVQYPNGEQCEPGGVAGRVALGPADRV